MTEAVVVAILGRCARNPAGHIEDAANGLIAALIQEGWLRHGKGRRAVTTKRGREVVAALRQGASTGRAVRKAPAAPTTELRAVR